MEGVIKMDRTIVVEYFDGEKKVKKVIILKYSHEKLPYTRICENLLTYG